MTTEELQDAIQGKYDSLKDELKLDDLVSPTRHRDGLGGITVVKRQKADSVALVAHEKRPVHAVLGAVKARWLKLGGLDGMLGYPISDEQPLLRGDERIGAYSIFEGGTIVWFDDAKGVVVLRSDGSIVEKDSDEKCLPAARFFRNNLPTAIDLRVNRLYEIAATMIETVARVQVQVVQISKTIAELAEKQFHYTVSESAARNLEQVLTTYSLQADNGDVREVGVKGFRQRGEMKASREQTDDRTSNSSFSSIFEQERLVSGSLGGMMEVLSVDVTAKSRSKGVEKILGSLESHRATSLSTSFEGTYELEIAELSFRAGEPR